MATLLRVEDFGVEDIDPFTEAQLAVIKGKTPEDYVNDSVFRNLVLSRIRDASSDANNIEQTFFKSFDNVKGAIPTAPNITVWIVGILLIVYFLRVKTV